MIIERKVVLHSLDEVLREGLGDLFRRTSSVVKDAVFPRIPERKHPKRTLPSGGRELTAAWQAIVEAGMSANIKHNKPAWENPPGEYIGYYHDTVDNKDLLIRMRIGRVKPKETQNTTITCQYFIIVEGRKYRHRLDGPAYIEFDIDVTAKQLYVEREAWFAYGREVAEEQAPQGALSVVDDEGGELSMVDDESGGLSLTEEL